MTGVRRWIAERCGQGKWEVGNGKWEVGGSSDLGGLDVGWDEVFGCKYCVRVSIRTRRISGGGSGVRGRLFGY